MGIFDKLKESIFGHATPPRRRPPAHRPPA
jgi:hypothetical protein